MSFGATLISVSILNGEFRLQITSKLFEVKWAQYRHDSSAGILLVILFNICPRIRILLTLIIRDVHYEQSFSSEP